MKTTSFYLIGQRGDVLKSANVLSSYNDDMETQYFLKDNIGDTYYANNGIADIEENTKDVSESIEVWISYNECKNIILDNLAFNNDNFGNIEMIVKEVDRESSKVTVYATFGGKMLSIEVIPMIIIDFSNIDTYHEFKRAFIHDKYISNYVSMEAFKNLKKLDADNQKLAIMPRGI